MRYDPAQDGFVRVGSGYLNRPSGLAIAPSTAGSGSTTGWSLYASEFDFLWERASVQAPATTLVNSSLGLTVGRTVAGVPHPKYGKARVLAADLAQGRVLIATSAGWVLALDPATGVIEPVAGEAEGLRGDLLALSVARDGSRILALNRAGEVFAVVGNRAQRRDVDPARLAPALEHALAAPARRVHWHDPLLGSSAWLVLDGWVVWRTDVE